MQKKHLPAEAVEQFIFTRQKIENFTIISNALLGDRRLSPSARWLLCYVLSKPSTWKIHALELRAAAGCGRASIEKFLRELESHGYLTRRKAQDKKGRWYWKHKVYEDPTQNPDVIAEKKQRELIPANSAEVREMLEAAKRGKK